MSKFVNVKGEGSVQNFKFKTKFISIDTALSYKESVGVPLTISYPNENRIEIMVAELDEKHLQEIKMLKEFNEYECDAEVKKLAARIPGDT